jgi:hypothetical protein
VPSSPRPRPSEAANHSFGRSSPVRGNCWSASIELCHPLDFIREDGDEAAARAHGRQKKESNGSYVSNLVRGVVVISLKSARSSDLTEKLANDLMNLCSAVAV